MIEATIDAPAERTRRALADLTTYPEWLPIVSAVSANDDDSWTVTLRARLGPLARSKRLRMIRENQPAQTSTDAESGIRFVRAETDGRDHAAWVLAADVDPIDDTSCTATVRLHYSGTLWSAPLEAALASAEGAATQRLSEYLSG